MDDMYLFKSQDEGNRLLYAYYKGEFWFYDPNVQQWYISGHVREQYELAAQKEDGLTPDDFTCTGYGYEFVAEYEVPVAVLDALRAAKKVLPPEPASTEVPLPRPGDVYRSPKSGQLYKIGELINGKKTCYLTMRSNAQGGTWVPVNSSVYPKLSDAQGEFEAWIRTERLEPVAPTGAAAATTDGSAAVSTAETTTTSESGEGADRSMSLESGISGPSTSPARGCPAETADAASGATPAASPVTTPSSLPAFDYTGLDAQTVQDLHLAEREVSTGKRMAEIGLRRMADGVAIAHDALCVTIATKCRNGNGAFSDSEKTFGRWCDSVGLNRKAAERLLQVSKLFDNSTPREQKVLEELGPSLLYAAAKPSAPAELVQAVKDGDITTNKQYQDLLARYNAERAAREKAEQAREESRKIANTIANQRAEERRRASEAEKQRDGARNALQAAKLRGDKLKAENDALKAPPVEAKVIDEEEVDRRAKARAAELTAPLREELEALRNRHPADPEAAEQAIRDAYDSTIYTGRVIENAWHTLRPLLPCMDAERRDLAIRQLSKTIATIQGEIAACL